MLHTPVRGEAAEQATFKSDLFECIMGAAGVPAPASREASVRRVVRPRSATIHFPTRRPCPHVCSSAFSACSAGHTISGHELERAHRHRQCSSRGGSLCRQACGRQHCRCALPCNPASPGPCCCLLYAVILSCAYTSIPVSPATQAAAGLDHSAFMTVQMLPRVMPEP